jgi:hypothetical protein
MGWAPILVFGKDFQMRQALILGCVLLICICIAGSAQPVFAQDNGQVQAGVCRHCPAPAPPPPPCGGDKNRGLIYISPPSGRSEVHHDPSTGSPVVPFSPPYGSRVLYTDVKKDASGTSWYYIAVPGMAPGWTKEASCSRPPQIPPTGKPTIRTLDQNFDHPPPAAMTAAANG